MEPPLSPPLQTPQNKQLSLDNIKALRVLGKGAMGTVFLAHNTITDPSALSPFALKVVDKTSISFNQSKHHHENAERRAHWEISVLSGLAHPFLPTLLGSFEAHDLIGWAIPYCPGGDLNNLRYIQNDRVFSPAAIKFYLAQIVCALAHLHSMGIAYRDLKPENVLVQSSGHVTLTDFDLSRKLTVRKKPDPLLKPPVKVNKPVVVVKRNNLTRIFAYGSGLDTGLKKTKSARVSPVSRRRESFASGRRSHSFVGTEEYVSPEVVRGEGHAFDVDWWAVGVLAYEMLYGRTPFRGKDRKETFRNVMMKRVEFVGQRTALMDLIERLLMKDVSKRLGHYRGVEEIKEHEFFKGLRWDLLTEVVRPPFVPSMEETEKLTEMVTTSFDVREYFEKVRATVTATSVPTSPLHSLSSEEEDEEREKVSLTEF